MKSNKYRMWVVTYMFPLLLSSMLKEKKESLQMQDLTIQQK